MWVPVLGILQLSVGGGALSLSQGSSNLCHKSEEEGLGDNSTYAHVNVYMHIYVFTCLWFVGVCLGAGGISWRVYTKHVNSSHLGGRVGSVLPFSWVYIFEFFCNYGIFCIQEQQQQWHNPSFLCYLIFPVWLVTVKLFLITKLSRENVLRGWELKKHLVISEHVIPVPLTQGEYAISFLTLNLKTKWIYTCMYTHLHAFVRIYKISFLFPLSGAPFL